MADANVVEQLYNESIKSQSDAIGKYGNSTFTDDSFKWTDFNYKVLPYKNFKSLLSKSYRNYQYDISFGNSENNNSGINIFNEIVSVCCKSIGKLSVEIGDNTVKYFGRNRVAGDYIKYKSPITITFYDVIVDDNGTLLSYLFKKWVEKWNIRGDGYFSDVYTRRNYIDNVVSPCKIKVYRGGLSKADMKQKSATDLEYVVMRDYNSNEISKFFNEYFNDGNSSYNSDKKKTLSENSAYAAMFSGVATDHGLVNTMLFALLMGSRIVDVALNASGNFDNNNDNGDNRVSDALHELGIEDGGIAQTIENGVKENPYQLKNVIPNKQSESENVNELKKKFFTKFEIDKLKVAENLNVSLKHEIQNAYKYSDTFKEAIKDLRTVIDGLGRLPGSKSTSEMYDGLGERKEHIENNSEMYDGLSISLTDIPKDSSEMYDGLLDKLDLNNESVAAVYDGLNSALNQSVSEITDMFKFENDSQAKEVRDKLNEILDELIGKRPLNLNSIKEDLIGVSKYINTNRNKDFIKNLIEAARNIAHSDYYNEDKMETITQTLSKKDNDREEVSESLKSDYDLQKEISKKDNDREEVDREFKGDFDTQKEISKQESVRDNIDLEFDNSMNDTLFKQSDLKKENSKSAIKEKFGNSKEHEYLISLLNSRGKAVPNEEIIQWGDDIVEAVKSELMDDADVEKIRHILMDSLKEIMEDKFKSEDSITSVQYNSINEWYKKQYKNSKLGMPYTAGQNPFLMSRDIMQDITLPFQILMFALEEKRKYQTLYYDRMFIGGGWDSYINGNTDGFISKMLKNPNTDLGFKVDIDVSKGIGTSLNVTKSISGMDLAKKNHYEIQKEGLKIRTDNGNLLMGELNENDSLFDYKKDSPDKLTVRTIEISDCYPSSVELIDTLTNESTGEKSLPTFSVTLQFYSLKVI